MGDTLYRTVYFTLDDPADLELLRLILALPRSRRNRILKAALRESLPEHLQRHHPEIAPLPREAVAAAVAATRRPRPLAARRESPLQRVSTPPEPAAPAEGRGQSFPSDSAPPSGPFPPAGTDAHQEAERKLDRLLRTLAK